jgi:hypothetical protein
MLGIRMHVQCLDLALEPQGKSAGELAVGEREPAWFTKYTN